MKKIAYLIAAALISVTGTGTAQYISIKRVNPGSTNWTNVPFTPGYSMLDKGGDLHYQDSWFGWPSFRSNPTKPVVGKIKIPVLLIDWSDFNPKIDDSNPSAAGIQSCPEHTEKSPSQISAYLNSSTGVSGYFREISYGKLDVSFDVLPWIVSANSKYLKPRSSYFAYDQNGKFLYAKDQELVRDALRAAIAEKSILLWQYDADWNFVLDGLMVLYEGCSSVLGKTQTTFLNGGVHTTEQYSFQSHPIDLVSSSDPNFSKFSSQNQNTLFNRVTIGPTSGPYYSTASQVHELGHLLLGYGDNYYFQPPPGSIYAQNAHWLLSSTHGAPIPYHASALEKWIFGNWIQPFYVANRRVGYYDIRDHQASASDLSSGYIPWGHLIRIPINGDADHFLTVEFRYMAPQSAGGSFFNTQAAGGQQIVSGVQVYEVDRRADYYKRQQIRRVLPTRLQNVYSPPWEQAWQAGDSLVYRDGSFGLEIKVSNITYSTPRNSTAGVFVTHLNGPTLTVPSGTVYGTINQPIKFTASATDPDLGDSLTYSIDLSTGLAASIDPKTGVFTAVPNSFGTYYPYIRVTDSKGLFESKSVKIVVR